MVWEKRRADSLLNPMGLRALDVGADGEIEIAFAARRVERVGDERFAVRPGWLIRAPRVRMRIDFESTLVHRRLR